MTPTELDFFPRKPHDHNLENVCFGLTISRRCAPANLAEALDLLIATHDSLRFRFVPGAQGWEKRLETDPAGLKAAVRVLDLEGMPPEEADRVIRETHDGLRGAINLATGPVIAAALYRGYPTGRDSLGLVISHAVCDGYASMTFLAELQLIWAALEEGKQPPSLPLDPVSCLSWAEAYRSWAGSPEANGQWEYWLNVVANPPQPPPGAGVTEAACAAELELSRVLLIEGDVEKLARQWPDRKAFHHAMESGLMASWVLALRDEWGGDDFLLGRIVNGRRAPFAPSPPRIGWLMIYHPVRLRLADPDGEGRGLPEETGRLLAAVPTSGHGFGALRFLSDDPRAMELDSGFRQCGLLFNYLGGGVVDSRTDSPFFIEPEQGSPLSSCIGEQDGVTDQLRWNIYLLTFILEGKLHATAYYDSTLLSGEVMERMMERMQGHLQRMLPG